MTFSGEGTEAGIFPHGFFPQGNGLKLDLTHGTGFFKSLVTSYSFTCNTVICITIAPVQALMRTHYIYIHIPCVQIQREKQFLSQSDASLKRQKKEEDVPALWGHRAEERNGHMSGEPETPELDCR